MPARIYKIAKPVATHTRAATCDEVGCAAQAGGWQTLVNESTDLGARQAHYIRTRSGRAHTETLEAGVVTFTFPPGQPCFAGHRVSLDRPELYAVADRGRVKQHTGPDPWLNDCGDHLDKIRKQIG